MLITTSGNATEKTEIAQIKLKLKDNIKNTNTQISIQSVESSYESEKIEAEDKTVNLEINENKVKIIQNEKQELKKDSNESTATKQIAEKDIKNPNKENNDYIKIRCNCRIRNSNIRKLNNKLWIYCNTTCN